MGVVYSSATFMMRNALRVFGDWQVEGKECVPPRGPLIVVSNHQSNMDPPVLTASMPRRVFFMAKRGLFNGPILSFLLKAYGAFPLNRDGGDLAAIQWCLKMLDSGSAIGIFPEGTRNPKAMQKGIPGIAMIAIKSGAPILPVGMTGTERTGPPWQGGDAQRRIQGEDRSALLHSYDRGQGRPSAAPVHHGYDNGAGRGPAPRRLPRSVRLEESNALAGAGGRRAGRGLIALCGIIGYTGYREAAPILLDGLANLEYRGYDSAGISVIAPDGDVAVRKASGKLESLVMSLQGALPVGSVGIGHTRWATHGEASISNAHPLLDCRDEVIVVHNGIVENYLEIKDELVDEGHTFASETDSEVIPHLIEGFLGRGSTTEEAVRLAALRLTGAHAAGGHVQTRPRETHRLQGTQRRRHPGRLRGE